jgi:hypothetical protein
MKLPERNFQWVTEKMPIRKFMLDSLLHGKYAKVKSKGYIAEVDLYLEPQYHEKFNEFPLAPVNRNVLASELSDLQIRQYRKIYNSDPPNEDDKDRRKLIADLNFKSRYVIHHEYLKFLLAQGYTVTGVHRIMMFSERAYMKPWYVQI